MIKNGKTKRNLQKFEVENGFYSKKNGIMIPNWKKMEFGFFQSRICKNLKWKITAPRPIYQIWIGNRPFTCSFGAIKSVL